MIENIYISLSEILFPSLFSAINNLLPQNTFAIINQVREIICLDNSEVEWISLSESILKHYPKREDFLGDLGKQMQIEKEVERLIKKLHSVTKMTFLDDILPILAGSELLEYGKKNISDIGPIVPWYSNSTQFNVPDSLAGQENLFILSQPLLSYSAIEQGYQTILFTNLFRLKRELRLRGIYG